MSGQVHKLELGRAPEEVLRAWPADRPLAALCSVPGGEGAGGVGGAGRWARWTVLAEPGAPICIGLEEPDPIGRMFERIGRPVRGTETPIPFVGGWIVALGYELGRSVEPKAAVREERVCGEWPWAVVMWRCCSALVFDHTERVWWSVGGAEATLEEGETGEGDFSLGQPVLQGSREKFEGAVARGVEYIRAGDVFEVNLAHRLRAEFEGSTRAAFSGLLGEAGPWYGAYLEIPRGDELHAALSASPELFLEYGARGRRITSRPIKGTRHGSAMPAELERSEKDRAELNMIVDLMRNDIGRVSRVGSVRVAESRAIERHGGRRGGVLQGVATVEGTLCEGAGLEDLLRAAFPAGSITGAPKVRAMQIIEELEPSARGLYTGAIGFVSDSGDACFNVAIRTAVVRGKRGRGGSGLGEVSDGRLTYGVGAGIVADSEPGAEFRETMDKAGVLMSLARRCGAHA